MFLLASLCHVGAHPGEHQHGVSIQISISLGKTFLRISRIRNIPLTWILARVFVYVPPFISQILDFIYWTVLIFILIYFEWRDTENQRYIARSAICHVLNWWKLGTIYDNNASWDRLEGKHKGQQTYHDALQCFVQYCNNCFQIATNFRSYRIHKGPDAPGMSSSVRMILTVCLTAVRHVLGQTAPHWTAHRIGFENNGITTQTTTLTLNTKGNIVLDDHFN